MPYEFSLAHLTVLQCTPPEMVEIAAKTGYQYVSLRMTAVTPNERIYPLMDDREMMKKTTSLSRTNFLRAAGAAAVGAGAVANALAAAAILLLVVLWLIYYVLFRPAELGSGSEPDQWLLPGLSLAVVIVALGLAGVLIRNLVKLIVERRRGILGSKLRIKLVFFLLAFVLLPAIILFSGSAQVIKQTVEAILRTPAEHLRHGGDIVGAFRRLQDDGYIEIITCAATHGYLPLLRAALEADGVRSLVVEVDLAEPLSDQLVTRVEALLETVSR